MSTGTKPGTVKTPVSACQHPLTLNSLTSPVISPVFPPSLAFTLSGRGVAGPRQVRANHELQESLKYLRKGNVTRSIFAFWASTVDVPICRREFRFTAQYDDPPNARPACTQLLLRLCLDRGGLGLLLHIFCSPFTVLIFVWPVGCQQPRHTSRLSRYLCSAKCKASSQAGSGRASAFHNGKTLQRSHCKLHDLQDPQSESGDGAVSHRWSEGRGAGGRARNLQQGRQHPVMPCHPVPRILSASLPAHT